MSKDTSFTATVGPKALRTALRLTAGAAFSDVIAFFLIAKRDAAVPG
jgi:hypothetical protein